MLASLDAQVEGAGDDALWEKLSPTANETEVDGLAVKVVSYEARGEL